MVQTGRVPDRLDRRIPPIVNEWRGEPQMDAELEAYVAPPGLGIYWVGKPTASPSALLRAGAVG